MTSVPSKLYSDDVSLVVVLLDTNPFFWTTSSSLSFSQFLSHVLAFVNSILLLNQLNQVVVIASGYNACDYIYDSSSDASQLGSEDGRMPSLYSNLLQKLEEFMIKDEKLGKEQSQRAIKSSLLSGSLSMALCYIQRVFRSGPLHPQPRHLELGNHSVWSIQLRVVCIAFDLLLLYRATGQLLHPFLSFCLTALLTSKGRFCVCRDPRMGLNSMLLIFFSFVRYPFPQAFTLTVSGLSRYVAVMNAIFSAQRSMVPIDSCYVGAHNSAFLQQASYITGGVYVKPQHLDGLFQYLTTVFATDLHSRSFIQLPRPAGVDFRASCFCHKTTIDMGYICSVCLSIFCNHHKKCSTCGSVFGQAQSDTSSTSDLKRKAPET
ncbi:general transcription and DNA repair factor IIH subunit TFB4 isoform X1 [Populus nigra]|uniref:general transcription and DNA repair factor IIH subunit TFB4 isoform X1 n=2 Tax=Populus nigra TaxID=3691 RepID=UPI002B2678B4|nr:general transcription and DNA repair factor IIH subunit TFB4 isoform X1 [Populus nigra]XP_061973220.1 general transcription and DNA repair factor IIH subunit TFB4 isoform X1 [Populus nigra]